MWDVSSGKWGNVPFLSSANIQPFFLHLFSCSLMFLARNEVFEDLCLTISPLGQCICLQACLLYLWYRHVSLHSWLRFHDAFMFRCSRLFSLSRVSVISWIWCWWRLQWSAGSGLLAKIHNASCDHSHMIMTNPSIKSITCLYYISC